MTERKPAGMPAGTWVDHQIRRGENTGAFEDLPLSGKPIPNIDKPTDALDWVAAWARRENVDVGAMLPPSLALRKEIEQLPARLSSERSETTVRAHLDGLNIRIRDALRQPPIGPVVPAPLDVEAWVSRWRAQRAAVSAEHAARREVGPLAAREDAMAASPRPRRRWWRRRTRNAGGPATPSPTS